MSIEDLIDKALAKYGFRAQHPGEPPDAYREAFITHIEQRDFAAAHELRVGKPESEWTADEVQDFRRRIEAVPRHGVGTMPEMLPMMGTPSGEWEPTDESMRVILTELMTMIREWRIEDPEREIWPHIGVLMMDGQLLTAPVHRRDRKGALKMLTTYSPCYGWAIVFEAFMHMIENNQTAKKLDVLLGHMGTRTTRIIRRHNYRFELGRAIFEPAPEEWDLRNLPAGESIEDPYADLLVSVPPPTTGKVN